MADLTLEVALETYPDFIWHKEVRPTTSLFNLVHIEVPGPVKVGLRSAVPTFSRTLWNPRIERVHWGTACKSLAETILAWHTIRSGISKIRVRSVAHRYPTIVHPPETTWRT